MQEDFKFKASLGNIAISCLLNEEDRSLGMELGGRVLTYHVGDSGFYPKLQTTATAQNKTRDLVGLIFMEKGRPNENMVSYLSVNEPPVRKARESYYREKGQRRSTDCVRPQFGHLCP